MVTLNFTLAPEAAAKLHDVLICLGKFSDTVSIEARQDRLDLAALNSSRTAYASFALSKSTFFLQYEYKAESSSIDERFTCSILNKALLSVFKGRLLNALDRDTAIERCEVSLQDRPDQTECRLIVRMVCNHGVVKTYKLMYESAEVMHALFDRSTALNRWSIRSSILREFVEYFGPKTEQLDMYYEDSRMIFTSFTEKIMNGKEILKQPLKTSVAANIGDFDSFKAQEKVHVIISVKDFKAVVSHAETLKGTISAFYSHPARPLQFSYEGDGMVCEFTLMTAGDCRRTPTPSVTNAMPSRATSRAPSAASAQTNVGKRPIEMPPPAAPRTRAANRLVGQATKAKESPAPTRMESNSENLFVSQEEEDRQWDAPDYRADEDILGWDASADHTGNFHPTFRDSGATAQENQSMREADEGLAPTQRISQIRGLW